MHVSPALLPRHPPDLVEAMVQHDFEATLLVYNDGTHAVCESDIKGLVLETDSWEEMRSELLWVSARLLRKNHGLDDEEIANATIRIKAYQVFESPESKSPMLISEGSQHHPMLARV